MKKKIKDLTLEERDKISRICAHYTIGILCSKNCPFWKSSGICIMCYKPFDKLGYEEPEKEVEVDD